MNKIYDNVPATYYLDTTLDLKKNEKRALLLSIIAIIIFLGTLMATIVLKNAEYTVTIWHILGGVALSYLLVNILELLRLGLYKLFTKNKAVLKFTGLNFYAILPNKLIIRWVYVLVQIIPCLFIVILLVIALIITNDNLYFVIAVIFSIIMAAATSSIYITFKLMLMYEETPLIIDNGNIIKIYEPYKSGDIETKNMEVK